MLPPLRARFWIILTGCVLTLTACTTVKDNSVMLNLVYKESAQYHKPDRNPVIVIPGILGSRLVDDETGRTVWGAFDARSVDPRNPEDALLLSLPISNMPDVSAVRHKVRPDGVLEQIRVRLLGVPIDVRAYVGILSTLGAGGYKDESLGLNGVDYGDDHFTCFQFGYDWRLGNAENAARLKTFIDERKAFVRAKYFELYGIDKDDIKFDIVAHSMGGLLTRYFLRYGDQPLPADGSLPDLNWAGVDDVERVILVGPPNGGAGEAFEQLLNGYDPGKPILPHYPSVILGTFPSIYQLLPRPRHARVVWDDETETPIGNLYDPALWVENKWGLSSDSKDVMDYLRTALPGAEDDAERQRLAQTFQAGALKRAEQFHKALDMPAQMPDSVEIYLMAGDAEDTPNRVAVERGTASARFMDYTPGDGTVPRYSALMDERLNAEWHPQLVSPITWSGVSFLDADHIGLTTDPTFANNVLYLLLEDPRK